MNKTLLKTFQILKYIIIIAFLGFSFYVCTLEEFSSYDYFSRFFTTPFIYIVKNVAVLSNSAFLGFFVGIFTYFIIYGTISKNTLTMLTSTKDFLSGYTSLFKIKDTNERYEAMIDFLFDEKTIALVKGIISFLFIPLTIFAFKGITIDSFTFLPSDLNFSFLWLNLNAYDEFFITPILLAIINIVIPSILFFLNKKEKTLEKNCFFIFQIIISLLAIGTSFVNVRFALYLIILALFRYIFEGVKKLLKVKENTKNIEVKKDEEKEENKTLEKKPLEENC